MSNALTDEQIGDVWISTDHITHATKRQIAFARGIVEADRALGRDLGPGDDHSADLSMLVKRLCGALRRDSAGHQLADQAMDFLLRKGLAGSPLRRVEMTTPTQDKNPKRSN